MGSDDLATLRTAPGVATVGSVRRVAPLFALMDATATLTAGGGVDVEAAFDPMRQGQVAANMGGTTGSAWWGYSERTALEATALGGALRYLNDPWASVDLADPANRAAAAYRVNVSGTGEKQLGGMFQRAPPTLRFTSFSSDVVLQDPFGAASSLLLAPASRGTLEALAGGNVELELARVAMDDVGPAYRRGPLAAFATTANGTADLGSGYQIDASTNFLRGLDPLHRGDPDPVRLYALEGSVCAYRSGSCLPDRNGALTATITVPKPIEVAAGRDVLAGTYQPQNNGSADLSIIRAGRDVYDVAVQASGAGDVVVEAGRDVRQHIPLSNAITAADGGLLVSRGDQKGGNPALPPGQAASIHVIAGASTLDWDGFAAAYLDAGNPREVARTYLPELTDYMSRLGYPALTGAELVATFQALPRARREVFLLDQVYFPELKASGIEYNDPASRRYHSYDRGFRAVSLLDPPGASASTARGDVDLAGKPVETWAAGDIAIFAPHGTVAVGTEVIDTSKDGGVVTRRGGNVRIMADQDIDLFTSRVFTLQGGDITMWTSNGSITAGSGSKTSVLDVPLSYVMSNEGVVSVNAFGLQTGAGIGVLDALEGGGDRPRSRLDLIAPRGEVDAGDAGIRVVGDINIAAQVVVGMDNISATGAATGVPRVEAPSLGALTTASQVANLATGGTEAARAEAAAASRKAAADLPSIITVEVVGYEAPEPGDGSGEGKGKKRTGGR
jgi:hypothetical protein